MDMIRHDPEFKDLPSLYSNNSLNAFQSSSLDLTY